MPKLIVIAGMPATGKTTLSLKIQERTGLPVIEKDLIKEELFDTVGFKNYQEKRNLDHAANAVLLYILEAELRAGKSVIVVNNFDSISAERLRNLIEKYKPDCITVFLNGDEKTLYERYVDRDDRHLRHLGHIVQDHYPLSEGDCPDYRMTPEEFNEKFAKRGMAGFSIPGARLDVDATNFEHLDVESVLKFIEDRI